jgi:hypothetical protein
LEWFTLILYAADLLVRLEGLANRAELTLRGHRPRPEEPYPELGDPDTEDWDTDDWLALEALPGDRPAEIRLSSLLKFAWRCLRLNLAAPVAAEAGEDAGREAVGQGPYDSHHATARAAQEAGPRRNRGMKRQPE